VYIEYYPLIVKMHVDSAKSEVALKNLNALCDIEFILRFLYILPLLETMHRLINLSKVHNYNLVKVLLFLKKTPKLLFHSSKHT